MKVWISFARFELQADEDREGAVAAARSVFERASRAARDWDEKEARVMLLEAWLEFEESDGDESSQEKVRKMIPKKVKKRRKRENEDGSDGGYEEYWDYIFPNEGSLAPHLKLLDRAKAWKLPEPQPSTSSHTS